MLSNSGYFLHIQIHYREFIYFPKKLLWCSSACVKILRFIICTLSVERQLQNYSKQAYFDIFLKAGEHHLWPNSLDFKNSKYAYFETFYSANTRIMKIMRHILAAFNKKAGEPPLIISLMSIEFCCCIVNASIVIIKTIVTSVIINYSRVLRNNGRTMEDSRPGSPSKAKKAPLLKAH